MISNIVDVATVVLPGLGALGVIAWLIGRADADARSAAWRRIAAARRGLHAQEQSLLSCLGADRCPGCPVERYLREH